MTSSAIDSLWAGVVAKLKQQGEEARKPLVVPGPRLQEKQRRATELADRVTELLYGGSAGGGKSVWLRHYIVREALTKPNAYIGLVRRDLPRLKKTHARQLTEMLRGVAVINRSDWTWTFPNGSVIQFIGLQHEGDELNYNSTEFDLLAFDELTEFTEDQYTYMLSRLRSSSGNGDGHAVAATNPIGIGYSWVKRYWVKPKESDLAPGGTMPAAYESWSTPVWTEEADGTRTWEPGPTRAFVPATVFDNPALLASNPGYLLRLKSNPDPRKRKALLDGDWDAMDKVDGALFSMSNITENRVNSCPPLMKIAVAIDPAGTTGPFSDSTGIVAAGIDARTHMYVLADRSGKYGPAQWARSAIALYLELEANVIVVEKNAGAGSDSLLRNIEIEAHAMMREGLLDHMPIVKPVVASRGKYVRAEPVAGAYLQGLVHHVGDFEDLEGQLTTWLPTSGYSPDRLDALVWALSAFMPDPNEKPDKPKAVRFNQGPARRRRR